MAEAARVLQPAGRAVLAEPDWRTLVIDHPEPQLPEAFVRYVVDHQIRNPRIGTALPRLCREAGLVVTTVRALTTVFDTVAAADRVLGFDRVSRRAVEHGFLSTADRQRWLDDLVTDWACASVTLFMVTAVKAS